MRATLLSFVMSSKVEIGLNVSGKGFLDSARNDNKDKRFYGQRLDSQLFGVHIQVFVRSFCKRRLNKWRLTQTPYTGSTE
jgi:hypothetical protein